VGACEALDRVWREIGTGGRAADHDTTRRIEREAIHTREKFVEHALRQNSGARYPLSTHSGRSCKCAIHDGSS
jgi:hypothetical protein